MLGSILKRERLQRNMKQEVLCNKICSVSYLSKIESDQAKPSEEILTLLFERLHIPYAQTVDTAALHKLFDEIEEYVFYQEFDQETNARFLRQLQGFQYSPFYWDVYLHALLVQDDFAQGFPMDEALPQTYQYHPYIAFVYASRPQTPDTVQDTIHRLLLAKGQDKVGIIDLALARIYFHTGQFSLAIEYAQNTLETAAYLGNVHLLASAHDLLWVLYMYQDFEKALYHYHSCFRLNKFLNKPHITYFLYYNRASHHLEQFYKGNDWEELLLAKQFIQKCYATDFDKDVLFFEKCIYIHLHLKEYDEAQRYFNELEALKNLDQSDEYLALSYAVKHPYTFMEEKQYADLLTTMCKNIQGTSKYTRSYFVQQMLMDVYRKQKRYKKAFELSCK